MTLKQLTERDRREWKLSAIDPHDRDTCRSGVRSAMSAASPVRKFIGTGLITGTDSFYFIASSVLSYIDTVYMYRLIPGPIYDLYIFPQIVTPFSDTCAYILPIRNVSHETIK